MMLRDHRAAVHLDAGIEHRVVHAQPVGRNAKHLEPTIGENWKMAGQSLLSDCRQNDGGGEKAAGRFGFVAAHSFGAVHMPQRSVLAER